MKNSLENYERLSALADGEWLLEETAHTLDWLANDEDAQARWGTYHLLGDVMRTRAVPCPAREAAFMQRLSHALDTELPKNLPIIAIKKGAGHTRHHWVKPIKYITKHAPNDALFHWRLGGGFAAILAIFLVLWQGSRLGLESGGVPQLAQVAVPTSQSTEVPLLVVTSDEAPTMVRDPQLDAFLAAHKQFGGTSAFQKPSGFLRNAVFEGSAR